MTQEPIGKAIKDAFLFLKPIYADTARVMQIIESTMNNRMLSSLFGSASVWGRSNAYYGDYGWLTNYLTRLYVTSPIQKNEKISFVEKRGVFFNVYFTPEKPQQPVIVYGIIKLKDENVWPIWESLFAVNNGPSFVTIEKMNEWNEYEDLGYSELDKIVYKVIPLVELNTKETIMSICNAAIDKFNELK